MGKKKFIKIGRKPKRELNPVEKWRHQQKEKVRLKKYISKLKHSQNQKTQVSKYIEIDQTDDPMQQELLTTSMLRIQEEPKIQPEDWMPIKIQQVKQEQQFVPLQLQVKQNKNVDAPIIKQTEMKQQQEIKGLVKDKVEDFFDLLKHKNLI